MFFPVRTTTRVILVVFLTAQLFYSDVDSATASNHPKNAQKSPTATKQAQPGKSGVPSPAGKSGAPAPQKVRKPAAAAGGAGAGAPTPQGEAAPKAVNSESERVPPPVKSSKLREDVTSKQKKKKKVEESEPVAPKEPMDSPQAAVNDDDDDDDDNNGVQSNDTYVLHRFNKTDQECVMGCSPSGVPYVEIRARPKFVKTEKQRESKTTANKQKPFHTVSGVSYESIRNRPKIDFSKRKSSGEGEGSRARKQKPFHSESGIPYSDIRKRVPLPDWYYTRHLKPEKKGDGPGGRGTPEEAKGRRPVDESLYTDPVLMGEPSDFFDGPIRDRTYLRKTLHLNSKKQRLPKSLINTIVLRLKEIYHKSIKPLETLFKFDEIGHAMVSEAVLSARPMVLFLGPWSTGKSTMINWFAGLPKSNQLYTGTQPTTTDFTAIMAGDHPRTVEGIVLAADSKQPFSGLEQFGTQFLEKFQGLEYPSQLLERVTLVDTPGIIENRHKQERGYPFNDVIQWFIDQAHLIIVVFDPTKLDVGSELETLFNRLKGRESQIRLLLNKADSIPMQELMRVYGALFWNLAPLMNVTEPPRVYTGSCWWKPLQKIGTNEQLFLREEESLLNDINDVIENQLHNKIAVLRQHAIRVRTHALLVDRFLYVWNKNKMNEKFQVQDLIDKPEKFHIFKYVQHHANVSKYDLPDPSKYRDFFTEHPLPSFRTLESLCSLFAGCPLEILETAISEDLPNLLNSLNELIKDDINNNMSSAKVTNSTLQNETAALNNTAPNATKLEASG